MQYEIKHKHVSKLQVLLKKAYEIAPGELESIICEAELVIKKERLKKRNEQQLTRMETKVAQGKAKNVWASPNSTLQTSVTEEQSISNFEICGPKGTKKPKLPGVIPQTDFSVSEAENESDSEIDDDRLISKMK